MAKARPANAIALLSLAVACLCGCGPTGEELYVNFQDEDPQVRASAAARAGKLGDSASVPYLVDRLSDCEPAVRLVAQVALERIEPETSRRIGYHHYDQPEARAEAIRRWREHLLRTRGPDTTTQPGSTDSEPEVPQEEKAS